MLHASRISSIVGHYMETRAQIQSPQCQQDWLKSQKSGLGKISQHSHVSAVVWARLGNIETT